MSKLLITIVLLLSCSCGTYQNLGQQRIDNYLLTHPNLKPEIAYAIQTGGLLPGMTKEQVIASWGDPKYTNIYGDTEQWIYPPIYDFETGRDTTIYFYFKNGLYASSQQIQR